MCAFAIILTMHVPLLMANANLFLVLLLITNNCAQILNDVIGVNKTRSAERCAFKISGKINAKP